MSGEVDPAKTIEAAQEFVSLAIDRLSDERGVHVETVIAGVARMAGTFLFRSFGFVLEAAEPGQAVLSEVANEQGPRLLDIVIASLSGVGIYPKLDNVSDDLVSGHEPLLSFLDTQSRLEKSFNEIREKVGLTLSQAADAAAMSTAMLIQQTREVLEPDIAIYIAAYALVEGTKTVPADI